MDSLQKKSAPEVKNGIRWEVFLPAYLVIAAAAAVGIFNKEALTKASNMFFFWSLDSFGWLFQLSIMASFVLVAVVTFTKLGNMRIGGKDAKPKYSFWTWFAMTLTGGIATGIVRVYGIIVGVAGCAASFAASRQPSQTSFMRLAVVGRAFEIVPSAAARKASCSASVFSRHS